MEHQTAQYLSLQNVYGVDNLTVNDTLTVAGIVITGGSGTSTVALDITSTIQSTSTTTGALTVAGGVGIGKNLNVGGYIDTNVNYLMNGSSLLTKPDAGSIYIDTISPPSITGTSIDNIVIGDGSFLGVTSGSSENIVIGKDCMVNATTNCDANIFIGTGASSTVHVDNCVVLGYYAGVSGTNADNRISIGATVDNAVNNSCVIGNSLVNKITLGSTPLLETKNTNTQIYGSNITTTSNNLVSVGSLNTPLMTSGDDLTMIGSEIMSTGTSSSQAVVIGNNIAPFAIGFNQSVIIGSDCMPDVNAGPASHVIIGHAGGDNINAGGSCTFIGAATVGASSLTNSIAIGFGATNTVNNTCQLGNSSVNKITLGATPLLETKNTSSQYYGSSCPSSSGVGCTIVGTSVAPNLSSGTGNTFLGNVAGTSITSGASCLMLGSESNGSATLNNQIAIGYQAVTNAANQCMIGNASLTQIVPNDTATVYLGSDGNPFEGLVLKGQTGFNSTLKSNQSTIALDAAFELPQLSDTLVGLNSIDTLNNKTINSLKIWDNTLDHKFTIVPPDLLADRNLNLPLLTGTDTFVCADFIQSLTNKTLTDTTNNVAAKSLHSATTVIDVSAATAPTSGQVLTATSGTAATWQTPSTGMTNPMTTTGDIIYSSSGTGTPARLAAGTNGHVLTLAAGIPSWAAGGGGSSIFESVKGYSIVGVASTIFQDSYITIKQTNAASPSSLFQITWGTNTTAYTNISFAGNYVNGTSTTGMSSTGSYSALSATPQTIFSGPNGEIQGGGKFGVMHLAGENLPYSYRFSFYGISITASPYKVLEITIERSLALTHSTTVAVTGTLS